ncbi:MAG TPA: hypothetical protein VME24_07130 [Alphaproteobacteria bacterium]|nr:hypothetical protein [Alphaproteobacteria bacterium]
MASQRKLARKGRLQHKIIAIVIVSVQNNFTMQERSSEVTGHQPAIGYGIALALTRGFAATP